MSILRPIRRVFINKATGVLPFVAVLVVACAGESRRPTFVASIEPVGMILRELVGDRGEVHVLLPPGASPHTYEPKPSDARYAEDALAMFYVALEVDGWAAKLAGDRVNPIGDLSEPAGDDDHHHNPHVWLDPLAVRERVPAICDALIQADPAGANVYRANADRFITDLIQLDLTLQSLLEPVRGKAVIQAHASWDLFLARYGIEIAGVIESTPGASLPPRKLARLVDAVSEGRVVALIAEPQLPRAPLETLAGHGASIVELDPLGGGPGMTTYAELILGNATRLADAAT